MFDRHVWLRLLMTGFLLLQPGLAPHPLLAADPPPPTDEAADTVEAAPPDATPTPEAAGPKAEPQAAAGPGVAAGHTGYDGYGYTFTDSLAPGSTCSPAFTDISATGMPLGLADDASVGIIMPFSFKLYGVSSNLVSIGNNGGLVFGTLVEPLGYANVSQPSDWTVGVGAILPFWDDLDATAGNVYTQTLGTANNRRFIVQWHQRPHYANTGSATFQLVLHESTNQIRFIYDDVDFGDSAFDGGASATVGIYRQGRPGLEYSFDTAALSAGLAICFTPPGPMPRYETISLSAASRPVAVGSTVTYTLVVPNSGEATGWASTATAPVPPGANALPSSVACTSGACSYDAGAFRWAGVLAPGDAFTMTYAVSLPGCPAASILTAEAWATDPAGVPAPTWRAQVNRPAVHHLYYSTDFEILPPGLVTGGQGEWEWGTPTYPPGFAALSGTHVLGTDLDNTADPGVGHHVITLTLALPDDPSGLTLSWWDWFSSSSDDWRQVWIDGLAFRDDFVYPTQPWWQPWTLDLSRWAGHTVSVAFDLVTGNAAPGPDGWRVDDLSLYNACHPLAEVPVDSLHATLGPSEQTTQAFNVVNPGTQPLSWGWVAPAAPPTLFDSGPLVTHPGQGAGGADASALQVGLGLNTLGWTVAGGFRLADDFRVTDPTGWVLDQVTVFAYRTGGISTTSPITTAYLQIWNGPPSSPSSSVVFGDLSTNRLITSTWTGIYRVPDNDLANTQRPIMRVVVGAGVTLPPGRYWLDWTLAAVSPSTFAPPVSILGAASTGDAMQTGPGVVWQATRDPIGYLGSHPQGFPFILEGTPVDCAAMLPAWLHATPMTGTLGLGAQPVEVTFDATSLAPGAYAAHACLRTDDPDHPVIALHATLDVAWRTWLPAVVR